MLPEYSQAGYELPLIDAAERVMRKPGDRCRHADNAAEPFRAAGWIDVRGQGYSQVSVGDILAHLAAQRPRHRDDCGDCEFAAGDTSNWTPCAPFIRPSRRTSGVPIYRAEPYWQWLVGRKAHSDMIVAVDGARRMG